MTAPNVQRTVTDMESLALKMRTLTCQRCGMDWQRRVTRGPTPSTCGPCKAATIRTRTPRRIVGEDPSLVLARSVTSYRLAIEEATSALRLGRNADALAALMRVQAPARLQDQRNNHVISLPS